MENTEFFSVPSVVSCFILFFHVTFDITKVTLNVMHPVKYHEKCCFTPWPVVFYI